MATIILKASDSDSVNGPEFIVNNAGAEVFGYAGGVEAVRVGPGATNLVTDQNVDRVVFADALADYTFIRNGNAILVKNAADQLLATIPIDADGVRLTFSDGTADADLAAGVMTLGGAIVSDITDTSLDAVLDTTLTSGSGGGGTLPADTTLKTGFDNLHGTSGVDTFYAFPGQNDLGMVTNTLGTGDRLYGDAGTDILDAAIIADGSFNGAMAVAPITESVENVFFNALAQDNQFAAGWAVKKLDSSDPDSTQLNIFENSYVVESGVRLNADNMADLEEIWSNGSEASVRVERLSNPGDTQDITIGMRSTGTGGSTGHPDVDDQDRQESNYEVYFDDIELTAGNTGEDGFVYDILNQESYDANTAEPVKDFPLKAVSFTITPTTGDATTYRIAITAEDMVGIVNHTQLAALLNTLMAEQYPDLVNLNFEVKGLFNDGDGRFDIPSIQLTDTDPSDRNITGGTIALDENSPSGNLYWDQKPLEAVITDLPITATVILDDVGRSNEGGFLKVGAMSDNAEGEPTDTKHGLGIEVYDLTVQRDSSLSGLFTTNGTLKEVYITSDEGFNGDLTIGNANTRHHSTEENLDLVKTTAFTGNLSLGYRAGALENLKTLDATSMTGNVEFGGEIGEEGGDKGTYNYMTGSGKDKIHLDISGNALDYAGSSLTIDTGAGDDVVETHSTFTESTTENEYLNHVILKNVNISTGEGNDTIKTFGAGNFDIDAGGGNDAIYTENSGNKAAWVFNVDMARYNNTQSIDELPGVQLSHYMLAGATLTVSLSGAGIAGAGTPGGGIMSYAGADGVSPFTNGIESTVNIAVGDPAHDYYGTQVDINNAMLEAINKHPVLSKLLKAELGADNTLVVTSLIDGIMDVTDLDISINTATYADFNTIQHGSLLAEAKTLFHDSLLTEASLWGAGYAAAGFDNNMEAAGNYFSDLTVTEIAYPIDSISIYEAVNGNYIYSGINTPNTQYAAGTAGTAETDNVIRGGAGDDVIVLSTDALCNAPALKYNLEGDIYNTSEYVDINYGPGNGYGTLFDGASNEVIVLEDLFGKDTIINFTTAGSLTVVGSGAGTLTNNSPGSGGYSHPEFNDGIDYLDFTSYLNGVESHSGSVASQDFIPVTLNLDAPVEANSVSVIRFDSAISTTETFKDLTESRFLAAINGISTDTDGWGNLEYNTYDAVNNYDSTSVAGSLGITLVGGVGHAVVMVENDRNFGEYKVFELVWDADAEFGTGDGLGEFTSARELGTLDFGTTLVGLNEFNLVGSAPDYTF